MSSSSSRIPVEERLFSLVLALLSVDIGLTKSEILSTVQGYRQRYRPGGDNANLERQFERDKDDLRELGVPLETVDSPGDPGNTQTQRYRIPRRMYELPADLSFTSDELALLDLAARVWREGSLSEQAARARTKLRTLGSVDDPLVGYAPQLRSRDDSFAPLSAAIDASRAVGFDYLGPGRETPTRREVIPLALVSYEGRWHLSAGLAPTGERRTFLLRRIVSPIALGAPVERWPGDHEQEALAGLDELARRQQAELEVLQDSDAALRLADRPGAVRSAHDRLLLPYVDPAILADELASFGPELRVLAPESLRDAVIARLKRTVADHG